MKYLIKMIMHRDASVLAILRKMMVYAYLIAQAKHNGTKLLKTVCAQVTLLTAIRL